MFTYPELCGSQDNSGIDHYAVFLNEKVPFCDSHDLLMFLSITTEAKNKSSLILCLAQWHDVCFSKVQRTFRTVYTAIRLFWKAGLFTVFQSKKTEEDCEIWWLRKIFRELLRIDDFRTATPLVHVIVPCRPAEIWIYDSAKQTMFVRGRQNFPAVSEVCYTRLVIQTKLHMLT